MNINTIIKIFPNTNCNNLKSLKYDSEGLWSITHPETSDKISIEILKRRNVVLFNKKNFSHIIKILFILI